MPLHLFETGELERPAPGVWRTPPVSPDLPATSVVVSWNHATGEGESLRALVRVRRRGEWSPWVLIGVRGAARSEAAPELPEGLGLEGDELVSPEVPFEEAQLELQVEGEAPVRRAAITFWPRFAPIQVPEDPVEPLFREGRIAQHALESSESHRICGPSSLTMALRFLGHDLDPLEVAEAVRCPWANIYGHWTYLAAYAGELGLSAWVERGGGPVRLARNLDLGRPVVLSLKWADHELPGAATTSSDGHLVLAVGAERAGLWVMDPAFRDPAKQLHRYDWQGVLRSWKSGASVVLSREG